MAKINDGGSAAPTLRFTELPTKDGGTFPVCSGVSPGMSLRDYFASQAINGLIQISNSGRPLDSIAATAYSMADAMLKAREQTP